MILILVLPLGQGCQFLSLQRGAGGGIAAGGSQETLEPDGPSKKPVDPRASGQVSLGDSELSYFPLFLPNASHS